MYLTDVNWDLFKGIMVVGDIHANYHALVDAVRYANEHHYYLLFLGDFVDGESQPAETVALVVKLLNCGLASSIIGNHEHKFYRYFIGHDVKMKGAQIQTLHDAGDIELFRNSMIELVEHKRSSHVIVFKNAIFAHGAVHRSCWGDLDGSKLQRNTCWYGEVSSKEHDAEGYKLRTYGWVEHIPERHITVTGHDCTAMGKSKTKPAIVKHKNGGTSYFIDTSCGKLKTNGRKLTAALFAVNIVSEVIEFDKFVEFE